MRNWLAGSLAISLLAGGLGACGKDEDEQRRALLKPVDMRQKRIAEREKKKLFDEAGELIPSDQKVAGLTLPRGVELYRSFEYEWYLEAKHIDVPPLERYFSARLDPLGIEHNNNTVTFTDAYLRDDPRARRVTVRLARMIGHTTTTDVYISQVPPPRVFKSGKDAEEQLEAMRKRAD